MNKIIKLTALIIFLFAVGKVPAVAQQETSIDVETFTLCLIDSISATNQTQFWRVIWLNSGLYLDHNYNFSGNYTITGTVRRCPEGGSRANGGCLVLNKAAFSSVSATTSTYAANTTYSISIAATSGTVTVNVASGGAVTLSANESITYTAPGSCDYLQSAIVVDATIGTAHVTRVY